MGDQAAESAPEPRHPPRRLGSAKSLVGRQGFEPWTLGLKVPCSTTELAAHRYLKAPESVCQVG